MLLINSLSAAGDMEFKQNKFLPAEKQIVTANPDVNTVWVDVRGWAIFYMFCATIIEVVLVFN